MARCALLFFAVIGIGLLAGSVKADTLTFTMDTSIYTVGAPPPPSLTGPWASATFTQLDAHDVELVLAPLPALGDSYVYEWGFNSTDPVSDLSIVPVGGTIYKTAAIYPDMTFFEPPSEPTFDFGILFNAPYFSYSPPSWLTPFSPLDLTYIISSSVNPISAATFATTESDTAPYETEALLAQGNGIWVAANGPDGSLGSGTSVAVPTPTTAASGLVLICGIAVWKFLQRRKSSRYSA